MSISSNPQDREVVRAIVKTRAICGGSARISGTRIPVWQLVEARELGASDAQILEDFPSLNPSILADAWEYAGDHREEIAAEILQNKSA